MNTPYFKHTLVTGGVGFIGSHLCDSLAQHNWEVTILDNLSAGLKENVRHLLKRTPKKAKLLKGDCTTPAHVRKAIENVEIVYHFAANPEVRLELSDPQTCFRQNIYATHILLQELKDNTKTHTIVFASTSTIYGEPQTIPTPEYYAPLKPISLYGASKLASEALISAYASTYNKKAIILRLANTIGPRSRHGVVHDFTNNMRQPILIDGRRIYNPQDFAEKLTHPKKATQAHAEEQPLFSTVQISTKGCMQQQK